MATPALDSRLQFVAAEYGVFWQSWPQFEDANGEHRLVGMELELIGRHASDLNHIDPACPLCRHVRSVLLEIADGMLREAVLTRDFLTYLIDSHSNSILCLPALGNRSAVSVSVYVYRNGASGQPSDTDLLTAIKTYLDKWGIHQR
jgi:hypothetical protein